MALEVVETARFSVIARRADRQRWCGRTVVSFTRGAARVDYGDAALRALLEPHVRKARGAREEALAGRARSAPAATDAALAPLTRAF